MWMNHQRERRSGLEPLSERKQRLLACACVRRLWGMLTEPVLREAIETAESFADGNCTLAVLSTAYHAAEHFSKQTHTSTPEYLAAWAATRTAKHAFFCDRPFDAQETRHLSQIVTEAMIPGNGPDDEQMRPLRQLEADVHQKYLEDVEQRLNVEFSSSWRTSTVVAIATSIYEERAYDRMPILADALQDAGCDNEDILNHCRSETVHSRGCFVVDLILGKE
jgi:hypothetical protein